MPRKVVTDLKQGDQIWNRGAWEKVTHVRTEDGNIRVNLQGVFHSVFFKVDDKIQVR